MSVINRPIINPGGPGGASVLSDSSYLEAIQQSSISWRAIFAGTLVSLLSFAILTSLGLAIGGANLKGLIQGTQGGQGFGVGSMIWMILSILISLYLGSYVAGRAAGMVSNQIGRIQGAVITALFFAILLYQVGATVGLLGRGLGSTVGAVGGTAGDLSQNAQVQQTIRDALGDVPLRSPIETVAQGLATRLLRGDQVGARNYLAAQTGLSPAEADRRIAKFRTNLETTLRDIGGTTAQVVSTTGWSLFIALVLGTVAGVVGGGAGAAANLFRPSAPAERKTIPSKAA